MKFPAQMKKWAIDASKPEAMPITTQSCACLSSRGDPAAPVYTHSCLHFPRDDFLLPHASAGDILLELNESMSNICCLLSLLWHFPGVQFV